MLEIEVKAYCENFQKIEEKILSLNGEMAGERIERDIYYSHPSRDFSETDEALRIRIIDEKKIITYKGPKLGEKTKTRIEQETEFHDLGSMKKILEYLGFKAVEEVVKKRTVYKIDDVEICLDDVENVGNFIELEIINADKDISEKKLFNLAEKLGLNRFERKSYLEMKLEKIKK